MCVSATSSILCEGCAGALFNNVLLIPMAGQEDAKHKPERMAGAHADSAEQLPGGGPHVSSSDAAAAAAAAASDAEDDQAASGISSGEG